MLWMGIGEHRSLLMVMVWVGVQIRRKMLGYGVDCTISQCPFIILVAMDFDSSESTSGGPIGIL
jgi:hypothetical protein